MDERTTDETRLGWGAAPVMSPLIRQRPWVSDTYFVAHESLPLFGRIAGLMGSNGWWELHRGGARHLSDAGCPNLAKFMGDVAATDATCVVHEPVYARSVTRDEAVQVELPPVEVIGSGDAVHYFDPHLVAAVWTDMTWSLALHRGVHILVGRDRRKGRPRFALAELTPDDGSGE